MFRLIVTCPDGTEVISDVSPLASRHDAGLDAMRILGREQPGITTDRPAITITQGKELGRQVRDAPLGEAVTHPSGYTFRTENF